jgi:hypothetical protein
MALSGQPKGTQSVPRRSPTSHVGRVITLIVRGSVCSGTLLGIWGGATRRVRFQASTAASEPGIQRRITPGRIPWWAPVLMLAARPVFALVTQLTVAVGFRLKRHPKPLLEAGRWWMVSGTLIDLLSLGMLTWLTRREGIRLTDLLNVRRDRLGRDLLLALGDLVALMPAVGIGAAFTRLFYGPSGQPPQVAAARGLPQVAAAYSVLVWPVLWSMTEEATYVGYTLPRLEALLGNTAMSAALVSAVWALQHEALPLLPERRYLVYRPLSALPVTLSTTLLSLLQGRRLPPLMGAHWAADSASALLAALPQRHLCGAPTQ